MSSRIRSRRENTDIGPKPFESEGKLHDLYGYRICSTKTKNTPAAIQIEPNLPPQQRGNIDKNVESFEISDQVEANCKNDSARKEVLESFCHECKKRYFISKHRMLRFQFMSDRISHLETVACFFSAIILDATSAFTYLPNLNDLC